MKFILKREPFSLYWPLNTFAPSNYSPTPLPHPFYLSFLPLPLIPLPLTYSLYPSSLPPSSPSLLSLPPSHLPSSGTNVIVRIPVPKATMSASHEPLGPGQTTELRLQDKTYVWKLKKAEGGSEQLLILKVHVYMSHAAGLSLSPWVRGELVYM